ncbi:nucleoside deaminase [Gordonia sp. TBRC 11910]|uniref:Nucleoside deaminase n=1 Tax=Gordonia asplenii TaxID=2725283 RepID=A0A848L3K5_9ACTN|nr:nucleoside deaminase [Gordonia asplenii]NMO03161.1 nucleoside deaminase [Gordonia asplenii]
MTDELSTADRQFLRAAVELARDAVAAGDEAFGSLLVDAAGVTLFADRNRVSGGDATRHPELAIAMWAVQNLSADERRTSVVYTSGEHCPMCSAAHAWVGLGRIVFASSSAQLAAWQAEWNLAAGPVASLPINVVAPTVPTSGPDPDLADEIRALHAAALGV